MKKSNKQKFVEKLITSFDVPFLDMDSCYLCNSHNGPFCWITIKGGWRFVCEDCCEKIFKTDAVLEKVKKEG